MGNSKFRRETEHRVAILSVALANILIVATFEFSLSYLPEDSSISAKYMVGSAIGLIIVIFLELTLMIPRKKIEFNWGNNKLNIINNSLRKEFSWYFFGMIAPVVLSYVLLLWIFDFQMSGTPIGVACCMWLTIRSLEIWQHYTSKREKMRVHSVDESNL